MEPETMAHSFEAQLAMLTKFSITSSVLFSDKLYFWDRGSRIGQVKPGKDGKCKHNPQWDEEGHTKSVLD